MDLPPDLEDVFFEKGLIAPQPTQVTTKLPVDGDAPSLRLQMMSESALAARGKADSSGSGAAQPSKPVGSKAGLKRGFLLGGDRSSGVSARTKESATLLISSEPKSKGPDQFVFNEVQLALADAVPPMQKLVSDTQKWMTPELLAAVASDPVLSAGMSNPRFMAAFAELQRKDPREAMLRFKDDAPLMAFLQKFMGLMGDHMVKLGSAESASVAAKDNIAAPVAAPREDRERRVLIEEVLPTSVAPRDSTRKNPPVRGSLSAAMGPGGLSTDDIVHAAETGMIAGSDAEVRAVLSNRELMSILSDPVIQRVMSECSTDGSKLSHFMRDPDISAKLRVLSKHGLIKITAR